MRCGLVTVEYGPLRVRRWRRGRAASPSPGRAYAVQADNLAGRKRTEAYGAGCLYDFYGFGT